MTENTQVNCPTNDELQVLVRNAEDFEKYFRKKAALEEMGKGEWKSNGKKGFRYTLQDGSYVQVKFFDTIKKIFNSKNVEVPGRESWLSYIDVSVFPAGMKAYCFTCDMAQHVWAYAKGRPPAKESHAISIGKLKAKAAAFGIDLENSDNWETYFAKHFQKKADK